MRVLLGMLTRILRVEGCINCGDEAASVARTEDGREGGAVGVRGNRGGVDCEEDVGGVPGVARVVVCARLN